MKLRWQILGFLVFACGMIHAEPFLILSARNLDTMIQGSMKVAEAFEPGSSEKANRGWLGGLGGAVTNGVDRTRPWHWATFSETAGGNPWGSWYAYYVPVTNYAAFVKALPEGGFKQRHQLLESGDHAVFVRKFTWKQNLTPAELDRARDWAKVAPRKLRHDVSLVFELASEMRALAVLGVSLARSALAEQLKPAAKRDERVQTAMLLPGGYEMLAMHLDLATAIVKGTKRLTITLDLEEDRLVFRDRIEALPGSDLARLMRPAKSDLPALIKHFDADTPVVVAAHIEGEGYLRESFLKAMRDGGKAAGTAFDEQFRAETEALLDAMSPVSLAMGVDWRSKYRTAAVYDFAQREAAEVQGRLLELLPRLLNARQNVDQVYSQIEVRKNVRAVDELKIDRLTAKLNLKSPVFAGRKETLSHLWPDGEVKIEFASQDARMFYASGEPLEKASRPSDNPLLPTVSAGTNTVILARFNLVELMIQNLVNQSKPSLGDIRTLGILDPKGAAIDARVDLDRRGVSGEASVPLRLLTEFGKFINREKQVR